MTDSELVDLLKSKFGAVKRTNGNWIQIRCPTCTPRDASKMKRGVNLQTLHTKCWICEIKLNIQDILGTKKLARIDTSALVREDHPQAKELPCSSLVPINELDHAHPAIQFLKKDHLFDLDRYWLENQIGYITSENSHDLIFKKFDRTTKINTADSICFPVKFRNELVGWQLRFIPGTPNGNRMSKIRYMHLFHKGDYLYNYDNAIKYDTVVVVEGAKKALKLPCAVATFGKSISDNQIQKLLNWKKIIFMYDGETETQEKTQILVDQLNMTDRECINIDPRKYGFSSPDEMPEDDAIKIIYNELNNGHRTT